MVRLKPVGEQVVVVMGASSGIGRLTALQFAERGARVVASAQDDPDNLFGPVRGLDTVEGSFGDRAHPRSLYNWLELRSALKRAAALGAARGTLAVLRGRS